MVVMMLTAMVTTSLATISTTGLYLHLNADSVGAADGATVTTWTDLAGGQAFTGTATYETDWHGSGHAAMTFDGAAEMMSCLLTAAPAENSMVMIAFGTWNSDVQAYYDYMTSGVGTDRARIFEDRGDIGARIGGGGTAINTSLNPLGYGDPFAIAVRTSGSYTDVWVMGNDLVFNWAGASGTVGSNALPKLNLAANDGGTEFSNVDILDILIYDQSVAGLGSGDIQAIAEELHALYVPEPATLALLGLGGLVMRRRK
jgi:hypothetical protein